MFVPHSPVPGADTRAP